MRERLPVLGLGNHLLLNFVRVVGAASRYRPLAGLSTGWRVVPAAGCGVQMSRFCRFFRAVCFQVRSVSELGFRHDALVWLACSLDTVPGFAAAL